MADDTTTLPILNTIVQKMSGVLSSLEKTLFKQTDMLGSLTDVSDRIAKSNERVEQERKLNQIEEDDRLRDERRANDHKGNQKEESDKKSHSLIESLTASLNRITDFTKSTKNIGISIFSGIFTLLKGASFLGLIALAVPIVKNFFNGFLEGMNLGVDDLPDNLKSVVDGFSDLNNILEKVGSALETASGWLSWLNSSNPEVSNEHATETLAVGAGASGIMGLINGIRGGRLRMLSRMIRDGAIGYGLISVWNQLMDTMGLEGMKLNSSWSTVVGAGASVAPSAARGVTALVRSSARGGSAMAGEALGAEGAAGRAATRAAGRTGVAGFLSRVAASPLGRVAGTVGKVGARFLGPVGWALMAKDAINLMEYMRQHAQWKDDELADTSNPDARLSLMDSISWMRANMNSAETPEEEKLRRIRELMSSYDNIDDFDTLFGGISGSARVFMNDDDVAKDMIRLMEDLNANPANYMTGAGPETDLTAAYATLSSLQSALSTPRVYTNDQQTVTDHLQDEQPPVLNGVTPIQLPQDNSIPPMPTEEENRRGFMYGVLGKLLTGLNPSFNVIENRLPEANLDSILQRINPIITTGSTNNLMNMSAPVVNNSGGNVSNVTNNSIVNIVQSSLDRSPWTLTT